MDNDELLRLLDVAILREVASYEFYAGVAGKAANARVREMFAELAAQEKSHEELLTRFRHDPTLRMNFQAPVNYRIAEETAPAELSPDMKPADAVAVAMRRELQAMQFYLDLAEMAAEPQLKELCVSLSNMEANHKRRLENLFVEIGYPEAW